MKLNTENWFVSQAIACLSVPIGTLHLWPWHCITSISNMAFYTSCESNRASTPNPLPQDFTGCHLPTLACTLVYHRPGQLKNQVDCPLFCSFCILFFVPSKPRPSLICSTATEHLLQPCLTNVHILMDPTNPTTPLLYPPACCFVPVLIYSRNTC